MVHPQAEKDTKGAVYNLNALCGKLLAGVNNKVVLYRWNTRIDDSCELVSECTHAGHILALYVAVRGEFIVVGDLMKSMSLLIYKPEARVAARARAVACTLTDASRRACRRASLRSVRATPTARG